MWEQPRERRLVCRVDKQGIRVDMPRHSNDFFTDSPAREPFCFHLSPQMNVTLRHQTVVLASVSHMVCFYRTSLSVLIHHLLSFIIYPEREFSRRMSICVVDEKRVRWTARKSDAVCVYIQYIMRFDTLYKVIHKRCRPVKKPKRCRCTSRCQLVSVFVKLQRRLSPGIYRQEVNIGDSWGHFMGFKCV